MKPLSLSQRVSVVDMDEDGINQLLNSHGLFRKVAETSEPEELEENGEPADENKEEL